MKTTTFALTSAAFCYLTSAIPLSLRAAEQVNIVLQTGDGDSAQAFSIDIGKIVPTSQSGGSSGVDASISTAGITCQAFTDAAGTIPLDSPFTSAAAVFFNQCAANGLATSCVAADAVSIGAYCCAEDAAFKATCLAAKAKGNSENVTVELQGASELAIQVNVPDDGSIVAVGGKQSFDSAFVSEGSNVKCQAFSDVKGTKKVGSPFGAQEASLAGGKEKLVQALSCKAN
jgi:hypothetical protein